MQYIVLEKIFEALTANRSGATLTKLRACWKLWSRCDFQVIFHCHTIFLSCLFSILLCWIQSWPEGGEKKRSNGEWSYIAKDANEVQGMDVLLNVYCLQSADNLELIISVNSPFWMESGLDCFFLWLS